MNEDVQNPQAENAEVEQTTTEASPAPETQAPTEEAATTPDEGQEPGQEPAPAESDDKTAPEEKRPTRAERRIRELAAKRNEAPQADPYYDMPQFDPNMLPQVDPDQELTPEQYQQHLVQTADAMANLRIQQYDLNRRAQEERQNTIRQFESDVAAVENTYKQLNPDDKDNFDPDLTERLVALYEQASDTNPKLRLKDFVDGVMDLSQRSATKSTADIQESLARQAAQGAVAPSTSARAEKSIEEMTDAEIEAKYGIVG